MSPLLDTIQRSHLNAGIERFNEGQFWHAHEDWEELWKSLKSKLIEDEYVDALQGVIQIAALLFQYQKCNLRGVENMWSKCAAKLGEPEAPFFPSLWDMDIGRLLNQVSEFVAAAKLEDWGLITTQIKIHSTGE